MKFVWGEILYPYGIGLGGGLLSEGWRSLENPNVDIIDRKIKHKYYTGILERLNLTLPSIKMPGLNWTSEYTEQEIRFSYLWNLLWEHQVPCQYILYIRRTEGLDFLSSSLAKITEPDTNKRMIVWGVFFFTPIIHKPWFEDHLNIHLRRGIKIRTASLIDHLQNYICGFYIWRLSSDKFWFYLRGLKIPIPRESCTLKNRCHFIDYYLYLMQINTTFKQLYVPLKQLFKRLMKKFTKRKV